MPDAKDRLFRKEALERLSSPDRLDQLVHIVGLKEWLLFAALAFVLGVALVWGSVGRLPTTVYGQGVLVTPRRIIPFQSHVGGRLTSLNCRPGDAVQAGQVLAVVDMAEVRKQLEQDGAKLAELLAQSRAKTELEAQQVVLQIQETEATKRVLKMQAENREKEVRDAEALKPVLVKRLAGWQSLKAQGLIPEMSDDLLQAEMSILQNDLKIAEIRATLKDLESQYVPLEVRQKALIQRNLEAATARQNEIQAVRSRVALLEVQLASNGRIMSPASGRVQEIVVGPGQVLAAGTRLGSLEVQDAEGRLVCVTYFSVRDGKRIRPGMPAQVTPDTIARERFGGILGRVDSVSPYPVTRESAALVVGRTELIDQLMKTGPQIEVVSELEVDRFTPSRFRWSSSRGPDLQVSAGTTTTVRVTVEERAPLTYVLPFLRSASGIY
jgi:HlyD family secretion protein